MVSVVEGEPFVISGAGEYEIKGVSIVGVGTFHDNKRGKDRGINTIFMITIEGVTVCHCGDLGHELTDEQLELIENVDILMVPVGGFYTIDSADALKVINQIEPKVVIPMHYKLNESEIGKKLAGIDVFMHAYGKKSLEAVNKYSITKDKLPDDIELVIIES